MSEFLTVTEVEHYTDSLFRIRTEKPSDYTFIAGQFTMIGMGDDDITRAYSYTSAPGDDFLEFYSIKVPNGPLTSRLKYIQPGDTLEVGDKPTGTLVLKYLEPGQNIWMLATGTGIAPFISLLRDSQTYQVFENIHVVWSVRTQAELLSYHEFLQDLPIDYTPVVTQDPEWMECNTRITDLIKKGVVLTGSKPETDKVMICGSISFNNDCKTMLENNGWQEGNKKTPGTFVVERAFVSRN